MDLTALTAAVAQITDAVESAKHLITQLAAGVQAAAQPLAQTPDPTASAVLQAITDLTNKIAAEATDLAGAVVANTPASTPPVPPPPAA